MEKLPKFGFILHLNEITFLLTQASARVGAFLWHNKLKKTRAATRRLPLQHPTLKGRPKPSGNQNDFQTTGTRQKVFFWKASRQQN